MVMNVVAALQQEPPAVNNSKIFSPNTDEDKLLRLTNLISLL